MNNNESRLELLSNAIVILKRGIINLDSTSKEYREKTKLIAQLTLERDNLVKNLITD